MGSNVRDSRENLAVRLFGMRPPREIPGNYDVAVAIGIGTSKDGTTANSRSAANATLCRQLLQQGKVYEIVLVGGAQKDGGVTEAEGMWIHLGKPPGITLEKTSRTTQANAQRMLEIMKARRWHSAIICAETLHAPRVHETFGEVWKGSGLKFIVVPTFGLYDDASDWKETPEGFLAFDKIAAGYLKAEPILPNFVKKAVRSRLKRDE